MATKGFEEYLIEVKGSPQGLLRNEKRISDCLEQVCKLSDLDILKELFYKFKREGKGVTGLLLIKESHISIHTWPESSYAAIDIFSCSEIDPGKIIEFLKDFMEAEEVSYEKVTRKLD